MQPVPACWLWFSQDLVSVLQLAHAEPCCNPRFRFPRPVPRTPGAGGNPAQREDAGTPSRVCF